MKKLKYIFGNPVLMKNYVKSTSPNVLNDAVKKWTAEDLEEKLELMSKNFMRKLFLYMASLDIFGWIKQLVLKQIK